MIETLRVLLHMGSLHRLALFWIGGAALFVGFYSPWLWAALLYGIVLQFFVEYAMHRFLLHREPPSEQSAFNALYRSHIGHHEIPGDAEFFTGDDHWYPVRFGLVSVALHVAVIGWVFGFATVAIWASVALFVGSVSAFAFYEYCHTLAHLNVPRCIFLICKERKSRHLKA